MEWKPPSRSRTWLDEIFWGEAVIQNAEGIKAIRMHEPTPILSIVDGGLLINEVVSSETICNQAVPEVHVGQYCTIVYDGYVVGENGIKYTIKNGIKP